jgi:uncharacterized protein YndB with AHSA1/START domain
MEIKLTHTINASRERVFECIYDDDNLKKWVPEFQGNKYPEDYDKNNPVGKPFTHVLKEGGRTANYTGEILEYNPPEKLVMKLAGKSFAMEISYHLIAEENNKTRLEYAVITTTYNAFTRFLGKLFAGFTKKIATKQGARLKELAEGGV